MMPGASAPGCQPRIIVLDHDVSRASPAGSCVLAEIEALVTRYDVTVVSHSLDESLRGRVQWLRVPLPRGPVIARYVAFVALAPSRVARARRDAGTRPVLVQATEGQFAGADVCYTHFCHRAYLERYWLQQTAAGLRRVLRRLNFEFNAWAERRAFRRCRQVVAVSRGLAREIVETYPFLEGRVVNIPNPVDLSRFARPADFDRAQARASMGLGTNDRVIAFAALGDFSRMGLGVLIDGLALTPDPSVKLLVIGGKQAAEIEAYEVAARERGLADRVVFAGLRSDVQRWLWAADVFALPSLYEAFSLVMIQAAAAGLPVIATPMHGIDEWLEHGVNGWRVKRTPESIAAAIGEAFSQPERLVRMGEHASRAAARYSPALFGETWLERIRQLFEPDTGPPKVAAPEPVGRAAADR
jgi:glycosyltransferase involved in cell wall biosynthesis